MPQMLAQNTHTGGSLVKNLVIATVAGIVLGAVGMYLLIPRSPATLCAAEDRSEAKKSAEARMKGFAKHDEYKLQYDKLP
jgi:hypothetical protein